MARRAEVWAVIQRRGESWTGRMVNARGLDQPRIAFAPKAAPPSIALGTQVEIGLATRTMAKAVRCGALVISVEFGDQTVDITLDPDEPELFHEAIPGLEAANPERRTEVRVFPRAGDGVKLPVRPLDDLGAKPIMARVTDASAGGLGLLFPYSAEDQLCFATVLLCEIAGGPKTREVECRVRNRALVEDGVRYGVEFIAPGKDAPQPFEPLWDCVCGATGLLAASHPRCCACGRPRAGPTRIPDRGGQLAFGIHPYHGRETTCRGCGANWSEHAKFCGHCGLLL